MARSFQDSFKALISAATPLIIVNTFDPRATIRNVIEALKSAKTGAGTLLDEIGLSKWDVCNGLAHVNEMGMQQLETTFNEDGGDRAALIAAANLYQFLFNVSDKHLRNHFTFIVNAHKFWGTPEEVQGIWNLRDKLKSKSSTLILLSAPGQTLPTEIAQDIMPLDEPLPSREIIEQIVVKAHAAVKKISPKAKDLSADDKQRAVAALEGLAMFPAEQNAQVCFDTKTGNIDIPELWNHKRATIAQRPGLSMYEGPDTLADMADLDNITEVLQGYNEGPDSPNIILRFDEMEKAFAGSGTDLSGDQTKLTGSILTWFQDKRIAGIIFLGVPGCGKSNLLYAWANSVRKPVINVDLPGMQGSLLGESIANLKAAEKTIDAMGGGKVLAIATVNDVSTLPAPLLRRFDVGTFFFDIPRTAAGRAKILSIHRKKYGINVKDADPVMDSLWTGADIENCCKNARRFGKTLQQSSENLVKVMVARKDEMEALRRGASGRYISASDRGVYTYFNPYKVEAKSDDDARALRG